MKKISQRSFFKLFLLGIVANGIIIQSHSPVFARDDYNRFSLSLDSTRVDIDLSPSASSSDTKTAVQKAMVTTGCSNGFSMYATTTADSTDNRLHLDGNPTNSSSNNSISSVADVTRDLNNQWGVRAWSQEYKPIYNYQTFGKVDQSENPVAFYHYGLSTSTYGTQVNIEYGANASSDLYAGDYSANVLYTVILDSSCYYANVSATSNSSSINSISGTGSKIVGSEVTLSCEPASSDVHCVWQSLSDGVESSYEGNEITFEMPENDVSFGVSTAYNEVTFQYNANGGTGEEPDSETTRASWGYTLKENTISAPSGKYFAGWSFSSDASTTIYSPWDTLDPSEYNNQHGTIINLYAIWATPKLVGNMQNFDCKRLEVDEVAVLTDTRDNNQYAVKRLEGGDCWMLENLRLGGGRTLTPSNTNIESNYTLPASSTGWGSTEESAPRLYETGDVRTGTYYNYAAASAGTSPYDEDYDGDTVFENEYDICPKGWHIPNMDAFHLLADEYGGDYDDLWGTKAARFGITGKYGRNSGISSALYWSSKVDDGYYAFAFYQDLEDIEFTYEGEKYIGLPIRCIDNSKKFSGITTMQEMTADIATAASIGDVTKVSDSRNRRTYTIKKMKDGNVWMLNNLDIYGKTLTSDDSNIPVGTTYNLPNHSTGWGSSSDTGPKAYYANSSDGTFYNYEAATAGSVKNNDGHSQNSIATSDICPKGWRLPTGGATNETNGNGEFIAFDIAYGGNGANRTEAENYNQLVWGRIRLGNAGYYSNGVNSHSASWHWSSTSKDQTHTYVFNTDSGTSAIRPNYEGEKYNGYSIRCIAESLNLDTVETLQRMNMNIVKQAEIDDEATLTDLRENKSYTVRKLEDGNIWLMDDLTVNNRTLTTIDSNLYSNFTLPSSMEDYWGDYDDDPAQEARLRVINNNAFYNYYAATAGAAYYQDGQSDYDIDTDICPRGWKMPTNDQYIDLVGVYFDDEEYVEYDSDAYGEGTVNEFPWENFEFFFNDLGFDYYEGFIEGSHYQSDDGTFWWTSTNDDSSDAKTFNTRRDGGPFYIESDRYRAKYFGNPIRCVVK